MLNIVTKSYEMAGSVLVTGATLCAKMVANQYVTNTAYVAGTVIGVGAGIEAAEKCGFPVVEPMKQAISYPISLGMKNVVVPVGQAVVKPLIHGTQEIMAYSLIETAKATGYAVVNTARQGISDLSESIVDNAKSNVVLGMAATAAVTYLVYTLYQAIQSKKPKPAPAPLPPIRITGQMTLVT